MDCRFDQFAKSLADVVPRRHALRWVGGGLAGGVLASLGAADKAWAAPNGKVLICHVPPGNPDNTHLISVALSALPAHLKHGDGVCAARNRDCCFNTGTDTAVCTNLDTDATNCGACGNVCATVQACQDGECIGCRECFVCGGTSVACGDNPNCFCTASITTGLCSCGGNFVCGTTPTCTTDADCQAAGFAYCQGPGTGAPGGTGCCGAGVCVPRCSAAALPAGTPGTNHTSPLVG